MNVTLRWRPGYKWLCITACCLGGCFVNCHTIHFVQQAWHKSLLYWSFSLQNCAQAFPWARGSMWVTRTKDGIVVSSSREIASSQWAKPFIYLLSVERSSHLQYWWFPKMQVAVKLKSSCATSKQNMTKSKSDFYVFLKQLETAWAGGCTYTLSDMIDISEDCRCTLNINQTLFVFNENSAGDI